MGEIYLAHYELYDLGWFAPPPGEINSTIESYSCFVIYVNIYIYIYIYNVIHNLKISLIYEGILTKETSSGTKTKIFP